MTRVTFDHLVRRLEASIRDLSYVDLLVVGLLCRHEWRVSCQREVDARVGHQVGLGILARCSSMVKMSDRFKDSFELVPTWNSVRSTFNAPSKRSEAENHENLSEKHIRKHINISVFVLPVIEETI